MPRTTSVVEWDAESSMPRTVARGGMGWETGEACPTTGGGAEGGPPCKATLRGLSAVGQRGEEFTHPWRVELGAGELLEIVEFGITVAVPRDPAEAGNTLDRKSTRLNSSH